MSRLRNLVLLLVLLLVILAIVVFMLENQQSVSISFFGFSSVGLPLSACLLIAILFGMISGPLMGMVFGFRRKMNAKRHI